MNFFTKLIKKLNPYIIQFLLVIVLLFAAFLRLYKVREYMTFLGDEGRDMLVVYDILHGKFTLLGPTASVGGFFMGPIYYYFITPFLWLFHYDPIGPSVMVGLLGVITVYFVYKIGSEFLGRKQGLIAAFLYSISPLVIAHSRSSWNPNVMPFFSLVTMYALWKAMIKKRNIFLLLLTGILFGIDIQLHYVELFLGIAILVYILVFRFFESGNNVSFKGSLLKIAKDYICIFIGFILGFSPFLAFEMRHGFPNIKSVINFIFHSGETGGNSNFFPIITNVFFRLFGRLVTAYPPSEQIVAGMHKNIEYITSLVWIVATASFFYFVYLLCLRYKEKNQNFYQLLLLCIWFTSGVIIFGFYKKPIYDYYFEFLFPLPFLFVGNFLIFLWSRKLVYKMVSSVFFLWIVTVSLMGIPFRFSPNRQLEQTQTISKFVIERAEGKQFNFALITGGNSDHAYRYFFKLAGKDPIVIQYEGADPQRKTVTDQLLVVCEKLPCEPLGNPLWEVSGFGRAEIAASWDVSVVKVYKLARYFFK
ncbi:MAG: hypothetical protein A3G13_00445 [Candidatus Levybacteria bacterium RIFCSPLOWO2_12_FULL_37_7]|nr:MAG: hypothetical protein A3G13_00445 [Candidatus Levybacteria bacterium RIFCSPLOWO2_12_FULL_37_7]